jgi:hypothetical protein
MNDRAPAESRFELLGMRPNRDTTKARQAYVLFLFQ